MITENLDFLEINKLSNNQYNREKSADRLNPNAIYLTPEVSVLPTISYEMMEQASSEIGSNNTTVEYTIINCPLLETLTLDTNEHLIYVPLPASLVLDGRKVYFSDYTLPESMFSEITYSKAGTWSSLSTINDGRGWDANQILTLLVKGSGESFKFDYVRLLSLPYPLAESFSF